MADFIFTTSGGGKVTMSERQSSVLGTALEAKDGITVGTVFRPASGVARDQLVAFLNALDYSARTVEVVLQYPVEGEGVYRIRATRQDTQDELDAWIKKEREEMAKRLGLKDPLDIDVTVEEI